MLGRKSNFLGLLLSAVLIAGCGGLNSVGGSLGGGSGSSAGGNRTAADAKGTDAQTTPVAPKNRGKTNALNLSNLLNPDKDEQDIRVNKYLWEASLETLNFLPIEAADPFSGVIVMGWGTAPGSNTQFRSTILITDPALEAGSLKVAMQRRGGSASAETNRQIEDAILTRARQIRIRAAKRR